jgi:hypothetical protein
MAADGAEVRMCIGSYYIGWQVVKRTGRVLMFDGWKSNFSGYSVRWGVDSKARAAKYRWLDYQ